MPASATKNGIVSKNGSGSNGVRNGTTNGITNGTTAAAKSTSIDDEILQMNIDMKNDKYTGKYEKFHGDELIGDKQTVWLGPLDDLRRALSLRNIPSLVRVASSLVAGNGLDMKAGASLISSLSNDSKVRRSVIESQVKSKYYKMLHPPLTYLGDAFQYRQADGKYNSVLSPHLGQAGAPYAKTVPSKTHPLGALPDPGDLFDRLLARQDDGRESQSGLSSMLIYHATIIIHDIFRTNDNDKNISDSSSYLDLSPLYGYTMEMQRKVRDDKYKLGLLKPDTFAEDRLLRQPPGVCIMLVMYNRYHNYAASQLRRINENGRFSVPKKFDGAPLEALAKWCYQEANDTKFLQACKEYSTAREEYQAREPPFEGHKWALKKAMESINKELVAIAKELREIQMQLMAGKITASEADAQQDDALKRQAQAKERGAEEQSKAEIKARENAEKFQNSEVAKRLQKCEAVLEDYISGTGLSTESRQSFESEYAAAWNKLDDDLFNTARLITCGQYIQVSIHDYLRALMGFHQWDTNFTLDPRLEIDHRNVSRGIGNQVTVEFNLLYRFHCAISLKDEAYTEAFMKEKMFIDDPKKLPLDEFVKIMKMGAAAQSAHPVEPWEQTFGLETDEKMHFDRNPFTGLFDDQKMVDELSAAMDDPISNFGPRNVPKCLKAVEIMGIIQARKWETGTLNDFREFFMMPRHETFESVTSNVEIQNALRDLYEHPDKIELYPGVFCESDATMNLDPGPSDVDSALWAAIFSDAITLVRSDRFYTVDWNTNSLTSWGMKEVTPDNDVCKTSVFHRLIQRAFPGWFPYNSIRFFHPFYTGQANARFAKEQGYAPGFRMNIKPEGKDDMGRPIFNVQQSMPEKPWKVINVTQADRIEAIITDTTGSFRHPALKDPSLLPPGMARFFEQKRTVKKLAGAKPVQEDPKAIQKYFSDLMKYIIKRESVAMTSAVYQIDVTRDFAIPVSVRCVADFLGFGHLIASEKTAKGKYSENQIYQHITNCQTFLAYNVDETKMLKRRTAFKASMEFLHKLTLDGNIREAGRWDVTHLLFGKKINNDMTRLGFEVAKRVLKHVEDVEEAAAIFVFVGLHTAYNTVLSFTSVLNQFFDEMYDLANGGETGLATWTRVQELAFRDDVDSWHELEKIILAAEKTSVRLPVIRSAIKDWSSTDSRGQQYHITSGRTVILDVHQAVEDAERDAVASTRLLSHDYSITDQFADYQPKQIATMSLVAMIRMIARMRNPRRGHDTQGIIKKIELDSSAEGYSNFVAPMRMQRIARQTALTDEDTDTVYTPQIFRPATDTFLTPEWDEFLPFPSTWKIRFTGFGPSDYSAHGQQYGALREHPLDVDTLTAPPFYQPQGESHRGGAFTDSMCVCSAAGAACHCKTAQDETNSQTAINGDATAPPMKKVGIANGCGMGH